MTGTPGEHSRVAAWQVGALKLLGELTRSAPYQLAANLPDIVPNVAECMYDAKQQVKVRDRLRI